MVDKNRAFIDNLRTQRNNAMDIVAQVTADLAVKDAELAEWRRRAEVAEAEIKQRDSMPRFVEDVTNARHHQQQLTPMKVSNDE